MQVSEKKKIKTLCHPITSEESQFTFGRLSPTLVSESVHVPAEPDRICFTLAGGYLAHSLAIMTDAAHLLADVGSMVGSLFSLWLSARPATRTMTFGWHRSGKAPA